MKNLCGLAHVRAAYVVPNYSELSLIFLRIQTTYVPFKVSFIANTACAVYNTGLSVIQISVSSTNDEAGGNSASDNDDDRYNEGEADDVETSCNTPTTVRRASVDISGLREPLYTNWFNFGNNSKSSSDDKEKDIKYGLGHPHSKDADIS